MRWERRVTGSALWLAPADVKSLWDFFIRAMGLFTGGLFILGLFTRCTSAGSALTGTVASVAVSGLCPSPALHGRGGGGLCYCRSRDRFGRDTKITHQRCHEELSEVSRDVNHALFRYSPGEQPIFFLNRRQK